MLFHKCQIFFDLFYANDTSCFRIRVMAIHTAELNLLAVKIKNRILNFNCPETNMIYNYLIRR